MKNILVLSGGGVKGYIQSVALAKYFTEIKHNLILGTSVGAINGGALALGMSPLELQTKYPEMVRKIFKKKAFWVTPKYEREAFYEVWRSMFGDKCMKDMKINFECTSIDTVKDLPQYFKSWEKEDGAESIAITISKSFAAPLFFGQFNDDKNKACWIDGGCGNENIPIQEAITETQMQSWFGKEDVHFDIFGTGFVPNTDTYEKTKKHRWLSQVFDFMKPADGGIGRSMSRIEQLMRLKKLCSISGNRCSMTYYDVEIEKKYDKLDGIEFLDTYKQYGFQVHPITI